MQSSASIFDITRLSLRNEAIQAVSKCRVGCSDDRPMLSPNDAVRSSPLIWLKQLAESSMTQPHIARLRWKLACWCSMCPGACWIVQTHYGVKTNIPKYKVWYTDDCLMPPISKSNLVQFGPSPRSRSWKSPAEKRAVNSLNHQQLHQALPNCAANW